MSLSQNIDNTSSSSISDFQISVIKITALWAFSESAFGGILHALTIPFRGLFISAAAVLFISLIALFSKSGKEILKSTLIVILIKALVSPHSPLTAYFAVGIQGLLGYLLFSTKKFYTFSALLLGIFTLFFSGIQKIVVLTILFGNNLWKSINIFIDQVFNDFLSLGINSNINYGYLLVGIYVSIHLLAGVFIGIYAGRLPKKLNSFLQNNPLINFDETDFEYPKKDKKRKKKSWLLRPTGIIIITVLISLLIFTYLFPSSKEIASIEIIIMLVRSVALTFIWYIFLAPIIKKLFQKYLSNKKSVYAKEIDEMMNMFPQFRKIVSYCWKNSQSKTGLKRIHYFLSTSFYYMLLA
ncbi:MAG: hypothetical protein IT276_00200 [Ignavibacteriaceae bacterium]|nr:hypothetical protein [Ignavibacteriaceae bacterium]HRP93801.1 hypothetical protein [Ignavibacteriaceae bacterium]